MLFDFCLKRALTDILQLGITYLCYNLKQGKIRLHFISNYICYVYIMKKIVAIFKPNLIVLETKVRFFKPSLTLLQRFQK